jgi:hypothetical protein
MTIFEGNTLHLYRYHYDDLGYFLCIMSCITKKDTLF